MADLVSRVKYLEQENRRLRAALEKIVEVASEPPLERPKARHYTGRVVEDKNEFWRGDVATNLAFERNPGGDLKVDFHNMDIPGDNY